MPSQVQFFKAPQLSCPPLQPIARALGWSPAPPPDRTSAEKRRRVGRNTPDHPPTPPTVPLTLGRYFPPCVSPSTRQPTPQVPATDCACSGVVPRPSSRSHIHGKAAAGRQKRPSTHPPTHCPTHPLGGTFPPLVCPHQRGSRRRRSRQPIARALGWSPAPPPDRTSAEKRRRVGRNAPDHPPTHPLSHSPLGGTAPPVCPHQLGSRLISQLLCSVDDENLAPQLMHRAGLRCALQLALVLLF